jgi:hypothetical protein
MQKGSLRYSFSEYIDKYRNFGMVDNIPNFFWLCKKTEHSKDNLGKLIGNNRGWGEVLMN